jgi:transposase-like protein
VPNDSVIKLLQPGTFDDQLTEVLRNGARTLLAQAVEAEVAEFLDKHAQLKTANDHQRVVRHGHLPEREVMTGIGAVGVRQPRVRDREAGADDPERIRFTPTILPPYARRSKSLEMLIPILYLKGISTGDFEEALAALLGKDAPGLSASTVARLKEVWIDEHRRWNRRDLSAKRYVYMWADGIHLQARLEEDAQCILVIIGATPEGKKVLIGFTDGTRESAHDWRTLLLDLKRRGLAAAPELAVADGALGFWKALGEVWPKTREQRRRIAAIRRGWVHAVARSEAARARRCARAGGRRRGSRVLESARRGLAENARAALLGAQDGERPQQAAEEPAAEGQAGVAGDLDGRDEGRRRDRIRRLHRELRGQIRQSRRMLAKGS